MSFSKRRLVLICVISIAAVVLFTAASKINKTVPPPGPMPWGYGYTHHIVGLYCVSVYNTLEVGFNNAHPESDVYQGNWPSVDGPEYLYHGTIWFGTQEGTDIYVISHNRQSIEPEWVPIYPCEFGSLDSDSSNWDNRPPHVEKVSDFDSWTICDDSGATEAGPLGLECERHTYSWGVPDHDDYVVHAFLLRNLSGHTLHDFYFGFPYDCDLGGSLDYLDDLVGYEGNDNTDEWTNPTQPGVVWSDPTPDGIPDEYDAVNFDPPEQRSTSYMYDSNDEPPGYIGIRVFGYQGVYPDGEFVLASAQHSWDIMNDPANDTYKFAYMIDVGVYEEISDAPYDYRICPSIGPFADLPNEEVFTDFYIIEGCGKGILEMRRNFDQVLADWRGADGIPGTDDDWVVASPPQSPKFVGIPQDGAVDLHWTPKYALGYNTETDPDPQTGVVDFDGYILWRSPIGFDIGWEPIAWWDLRSTDLINCFKPFGWRDNGGSGDKAERVPDGYIDGTDIPSPVEPDLRNVPYRMELETFQDQMESEGSDYYYHVDSWLSNGFRYFYSLVAYDFGMDTTDLKLPPISGGKGANQLSVIPTPPASTTLDNVWVVPNPYIGSADWEGWAPSLVRENRIAFMNLPARCTIKIYTVAGDWVDTIEYNDVEYGVAYWDLSNYSGTGRPGMAIASGIYVYHLDAPGIGEMVGKFAIILGGVQ